LVEKGFVVTGETEGSAACSLFSDLQETRKIRQKNIVARNKYLINVLY